MSWTRTTALAQGYVKENTIIPWQHGGEGKPISLCLCIWRQGTGWREGRDTARHTKWVSSNFLRTEKGGGIEVAWEGEGRTAQSNRGFSTTCPFTSYHGQGVFLCATPVSPTWNEFPSPLRLINVTSFQRWHWLMGQWPRWYCFQQSPPSPAKHLLQK